MSFEPKSHNPIQAARESQKLAGKYEAKECYQLQIVITRRTGDGEKPPYHNEFEEETRTDPLVECSGYAEALHALECIQKHLKALQSQRIQAIFASAKQDYELSRHSDYNGNLRKDWDYEDYMIDAWVEVNKILSGA
jgi:hypothetical protein